MDDIVYGKLNKGPTLNFNENFLGSPLTRSSANS